MPKSLADAGIQLPTLTTKPANVKAAKVSELTATGVVNLMCFVNKSDYKLGATGNDSVDEIEACKKGKGNAPGPATYEGSLTAFWYLDTSGKPVSAEMKGWDLLKVPGTTLYLFEFEGKPQGTAIAAGDIYDYYEVVTGDPQPPSDRFSGYIKRTVPLFVQDHQSGVVAAGA